MRSRSRAFIATVRSACSRAFNSGIRADATPTVAMSACANSPGASLRIAVLVDRMVAMTYDDGGVPRPATPPPPVGYPVYGPPSYPPPYSPGPTPGYPPPSYAQYPGYPIPVGPPPALKPGIIPLRPLGLSDIFNAAFAYIRANPRPTLGLTTIVVVITQIIGLILTAALPLTLYGRTGLTRVDDTSTSGLVGISLSGMAAAATSGLAGILLSGMLTVVVGRTVFGGTITIREAWDRVRVRLLALLGLAMLEAVGAVLLLTVSVVVVAVAIAITPILGVLVGIAVVAAVIAAFVYLWTMLSFAPVLIVLERMPIVPAISRSFGLVRGSFWRVFGIRILGTVVASLVAGAVSIPFTVAGELLSLAADSIGASLGASVLSSIGGAIGQIITAPFTAGIVVLLYTDRRIRAEAFDLVLQTGAATAAGDSAESTDDLWLIRHP
jgi:hypothetical protein